MKIDVLSAVINIKHEGVSSLNKHWDVSFLGIVHEYHSVGHIFSQLCAIFLEF